MVPHVHPHVAFSCKAGSADGFVDAPINYCAVYAQ